MKVKWGKAKAAVRRIAEVQEDSTGSAYINTVVRVSIFRFNIIVILVLIGYQSILYVHYYLHPLKVPHCNNSGGILNSKVVP